MNKIENICISTECLFLCIEEKILNNNQYLFTAYKLKNNRLKNLLNTLFQIHTISNNKIIQILSYNIVLEYQNPSNTKNTLLQQYLKRFNYIYNKIYTQYENSNNLEYLNRIAVESLYVIFKMKEKTGLLFLAKFLS
uniref:Uncharacterized protein n=1 Tax=Taenioma perpusillum TaxID=210852 RepID=A0A1Z1MRV9_9FLOR|nr:hypothetical protein [Taenioma perpusillum]ARW68599.1 hypothetical protein [Taenioma perpusillum]